MAEWSESDLIRADSERLSGRYMIVEGRLLRTGKYRLDKVISATNSFNTARSRALRWFRKGKDIIIIDRKATALIGNLWMLKEELV